MRHFPQQEVFHEPYAERGLYYGKTIETLGGNFKDTSELWDDQSCKGGINRWGHPSNSLTTYKQAISRDQKFVDTSFGTDSSSLYWSEMGVLDPNSVQSMKQKVKAWKRPDELYDEKPSFYGEDGAPAPTAIN